VRRFDQRQGFLVSAILHVSLLMILMLNPPTARKDDQLDLNSLEKKQIVFLPPSAQLKKLLPPEPRRPAQQAPTPAPVPTPPPTAKKDRISIGPPSEIRQKELILRKEDDLTKVAKGENVPPTPAPTPTPAPQPTPPPADAAQKAAADAKAGREGLKVPPGLLGRTPSGDEGRKPVVGPMAPSIANAVNGISQRVMRDSRAGIPTGTLDRGIGGLQFDPQGADFTLWVNRFKDEVYRNWNIPEAALLGSSRGHVDFEFVVERDGTMSSVRMEKSSGTSSLDKAAEFALRGSRLLPLPDDYGPPRITMHVSFHYNDYHETPQG
jgi:periplasmic protein TonB